jgi:hypothetical protein
VSGDAGKVGIRESFLPLFAGFMVSSWHIYPKNLTFRGKDDILASEQ